MTRHHPDAPAAFLAAVIADPANDGPRRQMADWFRDNGDDARAELIDVQCELARLEQRTSERFRTIREDGLYIALRRRESALLDVAAARDWFPFPASVVEEWWWRRGFVEEVRMPWNRDALVAILATAPVTSVTLTSRPPVRSQWDESRRVWFIRLDGEGTETRLEMPAETPISHLDLTRASSVAVVNEMLTAAIRRLLCQGWPQVTTWRLPNAVPDPRPTDDQLQEMVGAQQRRINRLVEEANRRVAQRLARAESRIANAAERVRAIQRLL